jgi:hypothetical protein
MGGLYYNAKPWKINILGLNIFKKKIQHKKQARSHSRCVAL